MVTNDASSHKTNYILNLEGHLNRCIGSKGTAILLNGCVLPTGGVALGRGCPAACATGLFRMSLQFLIQLQDSCISSAIYGNPFSILNCFCPRFSIIQYPLTQPGDSCRNGNIRNAGTQKNIIAMCITLGA